MKIINKKSILFFSLSSLMLTGCIATNEMSPKKEDLRVVEVKPIPGQKTWKEKGLKMGKIDKDCIDCYATGVDYSKPPSSTNTPIAKMSYDASRVKYTQAKVTTASYQNKAKSDTKYAGSYPYTETEADTQVSPNTYANKRVVSPAPETNSAYSSYDRYSSTGSVAIQVGAFSKYSGAKNYQKRYGSLTNRYLVDIKTGTKNNKPIHRVQILGFKNSSEAKSFMRQNGLSDAFLVK